MTRSRKPACDQHRAPFAALLVAGALLGAGAAVVACAGASAGGGANRAAERAADDASCPTIPAALRDGFLVHGARLFDGDRELPPTDVLLDAMATDKKRDRTGLVFVTLAAVGEGRTTGDVPGALVRDAWDWTRRLHAREASATAR